MTVKHPDLFGGETPVIKPTRSPYQEFKRVNRYRKAEGDENCGNCGYSFQRGHGRKKWRKCRLMGCSFSVATDVSYRKVCDKWQTM